MADILPLDGSNSSKTTKIKDPTNIMPLSKSNATATGLRCVDNQNDLTKNKKNVKSDKTTTKHSVNKELNATVTPSSVLKSAASTNGYQVNRYS